ncbi:CD97 antigen isoform X2 [Octodon degus]|uniref:CD97 antigen isoform X2 n=1 Tax=Octodon degus TaxID=10160 RepID=A0A6P6EUC6_OCTDE|nr:CD97 antigen isoform X2 [Octodon degus]
MEAPRLLLVLCVLLSLSEAREQNNMGCTLRCPDNSTCFNNSCVCKAGFSPEHISITDSCDDINECVPPNSVNCGPFADCKNTVGSYYCECSPGYKLKTGATKFMNLSENTCHETTTPATLGSAVPTNFPEVPVTMDPRTQAGSSGRRIEDVNQPTQDHSTCQGPSEGKSICNCSPGFKFTPEGPRQCTDVNECMSGQKPCHNTTHCINTAGSFQCKCRRGWKPVPGSRDGPPDTICEEIPFPVWRLPSGISSKNLSAFLDKVQGLSRDLKSQAAEQIIKKFVGVVDGLLEAPGDIKNLSQRDTHRVATWLLSYLEHILRSLAQALPEGSLTYSSPSGTELSLVVKESGSGNVTAGQGHARMLLDWAVVAGAEDSSHAVVGMLSSQHMEKWLANASLALEPEKLVQLTEAKERPVHGARATLLSAVNSVFLSNTNTDKLASPVTFAFSHRPEEPGTELICAFWKNDSSGNGHWATTGCRRLGSGKNSTTCQCNHLSSFAVLMAHYQLEDWKLTLITKVGLSVSLICLLLCIITFLLVRPIQSSRTTVHLHLCICLFVGSTVFLAGIENEGGEVGLRCRLVAGLLHYFFLAAFCWMSLEGVELYFLVVRVFQGQGLATRWQCLIGYGVPLIIVAISAAANSSGYGHTAHCWLDPKRGFLWSFLGPLTFVILCNAIIFVVTVWKLTEKFSEINPDMKKLRKARVVTITAVAQLFVLGCTWGFGLFLFSPESWHDTVLTYVFTVLNCLQGTFLFLLHCLLNKKVRAEYRKWACAVTGNKYSEFASSTGSTSQQTRALRPSESGI